MVATGPGSVAGGRAASVKLPPRLPASRAGSVCGAPRSDAGRSHRARGEGKLNSLPLKRVSFALRFSLLW